MVYANLLLTAFLFVDLSSALDEPYIIPNPGTPSLPPFSATNSTSYCNRTATISYSDGWGPVFVEHSYACDFPSRSSVVTDNELQSPLTVPAPYSHIAGQRGADRMVASRGTIEPVEVSFQRMLLQAKQKITIPNYGCHLLPSPEHLDEGKYSNLFWGMRQLNNQSCVLPGEVKEFTDVRKAWTADWRFIVANKGDEKRCDWWQEISNIAEALHYVCYFSGLGSSNSERSGGIEAVGWGAEKGMGLRWCMRYSKRGWGEDVFEEHCLGV